MQSYSTHCLTQKLAGLCAAYTLTDWPIGWLAHYFAVHTVRLTDQLTDWLTFCLTYTLSDWLAMLADCLCYFLPGKFLGLNYSLLEILPKNAFRSKWSCVSGQYQTTKQSVFFSQNRFSVARGKKSYFYRLFLVSLSVFSLQTSRPSFDCSRVL